MKHIYIEENALSEEVCDKIIDEFHQNTWFHRPGRTMGSTTEDTPKISTDCSVVDFYNHQELYGAIDKGIRKYIKDFPLCTNAQTIDISLPFNIQWYKPGEGFFKWHHEYHTQNNRVLAWMLNLNTVKNGGQTEFRDQDFKLEAKAGQLTIWPAYFTHVHRGIVAPEEDKYIATGWFHFREE